MEPSGEEVEFLHARAEAQRIAGPESVAQHVEQLQVSQHRIEQLVNEVAGLRGHVTTARVEAEAARVDANDLRRQFAQQTNMARGRAEAVQGDLAALSQRNASLAARLSDLLTVGQQQTCDAAWLHNALASADRQARASRGEVEILRHQMAQNAERSRQQASAVQARQAAIDGQVAELAKLTSQARCDAFTTQALHARAMADALRLRESDQKRANMATAAAANTQPLVARLRKDNRQLQQDIEGLTAQMTQQAAELKEQIHLERRAFSTVRTSMEQANKAL